jgi:hypothetical protein
MKKMDRHYVISNYNTVPQIAKSDLRRTTIYDQSNDAGTIKKLKDLKDTKIIWCGETKGHNLINYFDWIIDNYDNLPKLIVFTKGNMPGRHCSTTYLRNALASDYYQFLWNEENYREIPSRFLVVAPGRFLEINSSWYVTAHTHRYFLNFNDFAQFIFKDYVPSKYIMFSPGACYQVERERILQNPKSLYQGLSRMLSYSYRPAECFMVERIMHMIFDRTYALNEYCESLDSFMEELVKIPNKESVKLNNKRNDIIDRVLLSLNYRSELILRRRRGKY